MKQISRIVTFTILSMSLLTVMAGAAIAPALGVIKNHFSNYPDVVIQLIVSIPALFIIITNIAFIKLSRRFHTRTIAIVGLLAYIICGAGCFFADNIAVLLLLRALLGISVGLIMPLSTGLLAFYFPPEEQAKLMGLSAAMNQLGGIVATMLAGILAVIEWNYAFIVYLLGIISLAMVLKWLPNERLGSKENNESKIKNLLKFHPSVIGMLLLMTIFFIYPTNFAIITSLNTDLSTTSITIIMVILDFAAFLIGLIFGKVMTAFRRSVKYFAPILFLLGYITLAFSNNVFLIVLGSILIGLANGIGIPYLNTIASIKGGKESTSTVMPLLSAALYLGQFISPLIVIPLSSIIFGTEDLTGSYKVGVVLCIIFLIQVFLTRNFQSLPPEIKSKA